MWQLWHYPALIVLLQLVCMFVLAQLLQRQLGKVLINLTKSQSWTVGLTAFLFWPGTFIHELAHLLTARLLLVRAGGLTLIPQIKPDRIVMGQVMVPKVDPIRMFLIAVAPFVLGLVALFGLLYYYSQLSLTHWWHLAIFYYLVVQLSNTLFLSPADWRSARRLLLIAAVMLLIAYMLNLLPSIEQAFGAIQAQQPVWRSAANLLWLPLLVNTILLITLWILHRLTSSR